MQPARSAQQSRLAGLLGWISILTGAIWQSQRFKEAWATSENWSAFFAKLGNLPFYRAMAFTLTFTFTVTPLLIALGLMIALGVNALSEQVKGLVIFVSLLPMIVTPLIGSLILFWMIDSRGILGNAIQWMASDPDLSLKASTGLTWVMLIVYGVWHSAPFAFVVFYAGLQTLPMDQIESARIDGASRWEQVRFVIVPHLMPLIMFVALIQLMDNFRVFEPIVGLMPKHMPSRLAGSYLMIWEERHASFRPRRPHPC